MFDIPIPQFHIPESAAKQYRLHAHYMASIVSQRLAQHPDFENFMGGNPARLLTINHHNHAAFMAEVLDIQYYQLLPRSLPWVYATYHNQGVPFEYFMVELQLWIQVINEVLPTDAAAAIVPVYQWMIQVHPHTVRSAQQHQPTCPTIAEPYREDQLQLLALLLRGDYTAATAQCRELLHGGMSYSTVLNQLIYPIMVEIGNRWERGEISVAVEHQTTAMVYGLLSTLYQEQPFTAMTGGRAIVAAVTNEFHQLGAWMITTHLELEGWDVTLLSRAPCSETLTTAVLEHRPHIVALSVTLISNVQFARQRVRELRQVLTDAGLKTQIAIGGQAFLAFPELAKSIEADVLLSSADELLKWAQGLEIWA